MNETKKIRVLIAKPGLDGHDRGAKMLLMGLRDLGFEAIYTGMRQTPEMIVQIAIQEAVDVIGLSCHTSSHKVLFPEVTKVLSDRGVDDILVIAGGIIPEEDIPFLKENGIKKVFGPGSSIKEIGDFIRVNVTKK
jgi:methylmalonyl-CoA mutase, C-terminal domain